MDTRSGSRDTGDTGDGSSDLVSKQSNDTPMSQQPPTIKPLLATAGTEAGSVPTDTLSLQWADKRWPVHELRGLNALRYFCQPGANPFYDRSCNNQRVMQANNGALDVEALKTMTGVEYELVHSQDPVLHVIRKQHRQAPDKVVPLALYYMVQGEVYQCPDVRTVIHSHLSTALHQLRAALQTAKPLTQIGVLSLDHFAMLGIGVELKTFNPTDGYSMTSGTKDADTDLAKFKANPYDSKRRGKSRARTLHDQISRLIHHLPEDFPVKATKAQGQTKRAAPPGPPSLTSKRAK